MTENYLYVCQVCYVQVNDVYVVVIIVLLVVLAAIYCFQNNIQSNLNVSKWPGYSGNDRD
jgi:hypothetical protein